MSQQIATKLAFIDRLQQPKPLLVDGAMGTMLQQRGNLKISACFDELNLTQPELVQGVHMDYLAAGADIIETNTFSANRVKLAEHSLADRVGDINQAAVAIARRALQAAGRENDAYIAGSIGPLGAGIAPYGSLTEPEARKAFNEQLQALVDAGVDLLLFETFANDDELLLAVEEAQTIAPEMPIVAHATFTPDSRTYLGRTPARVANALYKAGATVIGVNCGGGPAHISEMLQAMHNAVPKARLSAMPNAGYPQAMGGRVMYPAQAEYFGDAALTLRAQGAVIVGGCCGTTPAHISAMRTALDDASRVALVGHVDVHDDEESSTEQLRPTEFAERLQDGRFTVTVEIAPPRSYTAEKLLTNARLLRDAGADMLNVADTPAARMRMSAWAVAHLLQQKLGIETVLHFPTRGRNALRVQGDLLAAHALGLRNLFITMGDPARIGDYPDATDSYDIAPSRLIGVVKQEMNEGRDMGGSSIGRPTQFTVGCALNMAADDLDREMRVLEKKLSSGADYALGQAVFDPPRIDRFLEAYEKTFKEAFKLPVLMGVMPLYSLKHAHFLNNEVPGIEIPEAIFKRLEDAGDGAAEEGVAIAVELMEQMRDRVQGAYIIPAYGRYKLAAEVVAAVSG
ncbi:bifunctional homocysteine S-methyltransferase/methylenetetrahydrofolate reductase [Phototrophicus methaneseepsis]|uniref:Bifunctional homocysteine S-methyltransferase/methylenetetrahydrofolate reductase n=1 Tax=Phototrophicus methaneseepsis TaxID=2710758 RepID=A0A7S8EAA4_9CHLR|nr:bifunctional homocysteine S-methyltransferase/methylenetetrahydrofolate reductase [Phototrophicus methaneseepsis]QPC83256.1 bifunctional homocysteine S-methyltransferase/methylenetetrahydrofolate reductase [Phototrophicus methaneseepsis]